MSSQHHHGVLIRIPVLRGDLMSVSDDVLKTAILPRQLFLCLAPKMGTAFDADRYKSTSLLYPSLFTCAEYDISFLFSSRAYFIFSL